MRIVPVPCLRDNYAYLIVCEATNATAVVDPSEPDPVVRAIQQESVELTAIWNTHHHWDHTGGNKALLKAYPELEVIGHESDRGRIPGQTAFVKDGDEVTLGQEVRARVIHNPGHTSGAISYFLSEHASVFTGDTLFGAGCGRLFEGTPAQMLTSLSRLGALPEETSVFFGHEYTVANLRFASAVEPDSDTLRERVARVQRQRDAGDYSVPSTIAEERATNPFLRAAVSRVQAAVRASEPPKDTSETEVFAALRRWKDRF